MTTYRDLATQAKNRSDLIPTTYVTDAEFLDAVSGSTGQLFSILAQNAGDDYLLTETFLTGSAGVSSLSLPSDFYKLISLSFKSGDGYLPMDRWDNTNVGYSNYSAIPSGTYRLWYIPRFTKPSSLNDLFPVVLETNGWSEWVVLDLCIKAHIKQETDFSPFQMQKQEIETRMIRHSANRDQNQPFQMGDWDDGTLSGYPVPYPMASNGVPAPRYHLIGTTSVSLQPSGTPSRGFFG